MTADYLISPLAVPSRNGNEPDSWEPINLALLPEKPPIRPTLGGDRIGIVYPGKRHVFSGPPESAKTLAAYAIGIEVVRAGAAIILIDFEMGSYDARDRLRELGAQDEDIARIHYLEPAVPATEEKVRLLIHLQPQLVIIDAAAGAYDLQGLDDNKRGDVEKLARLYVRSFWRNGIASIFIDHVVKDSEARGKFAIGSERKLGGTDVHLGFEVITPIQRGTTGHYRIVTHKDRGGYLKRGHLADLHLSSDPNTHTITTTFTPAVTTPKTARYKFDIKMEQISKELERLTEPVSGNTLYGIIGGNKQAFLTAVEDLIGAEYARRIGGAGSPIETVKPFNRSLLVPPVPGGSPPVPEPGMEGGSAGSTPLRGGTRESTRNDRQQTFDRFQHSWLEELIPDEDELALPAGTLDQETP
jgi:hypothetical protein